MAWSKEDQAKSARRHYENNKDVMKARAIAFQIDARAKVRESIIAAKDKPCTDCGIRYPYYVMQFDHVRGKKLFNVGDSVKKNFALEKVLDEIAKCEVVCANCHMERTHQRRLVS